MLHEHAGRRNVEDLGRGVVLAEVELVLLQPLVGITEAVRGHPHLFEASGIGP